METLNSFLNLAAELIGLTVESDYRLRRLIDHCCCAQLNDPVADGFVAASHDLVEI
jgi:hypothetical protein